MNLFIDMITNGGRLQLFLHQLATLHLSQCIGLSRGVACVPV